MEGPPVNGVLIGIFRRYSDLSDIVLLCDGESTDANPNEILNNIRSINRGNIRMNTIRSRGGIFEQSKPSKSYIPERFSTAK